MASTTSEKNWLRKHSRMIAFAGLCIASLAAVSTIAINSIDIWQRFFPSRATGSFQQTSNKELKSDSLTDISTAAKEAVADRWIDATVAPSELLASGAIVITTPANKELWPKIRPWVYMYGVDYKLQGDGDGVTITSGTVV